MGSKAERIRHAKEAIENLQRAILTLREDGATDAAIEPYAENLRVEAAKLARLEGRSK